MTRPPATYGELLDIAVRATTDLAFAEVSFAGPAETVEILQARARLLRAASTVLRTHAVRRRDIDARPSNAVVTVSEAEHRLVRALDQRVAWAWSGTRHVLDIDVVPAAVSSPRATTWLRAADTIRAGWDVLSTQSIGIRPVRSAGRSVGRAADGARAVLADAALVLRGLTAADRELADAVRAVAAEPDAAVRVRQWRGGSSESGRGDEETDLRTVLHVAAEDCERSARAGLGDAATALESALHAYGRGQVDRLTIARVERHVPDRPLVGLAGVRVYHRWVARNADSLTIDDLLTLSAVASRLTGLAGTALATTSSEAFRDAVDAWRDAYRALGPLRTIDPAPVGAEHAHDLAAWADNLLRRPPERGPGLGSAAATEIAQFLPGLAAVADYRLYRMRKEGTLLGPAGLIRRPGQPPSPDPYRYKPVSTNDDHVVQAVEAVLEARRSSAVFADVTGHEQTGDRSQIATSSPRLRSSAPNAVESPINSARLAHLSGSSVVTSSAPAVPEREWDSEVQRASTSDRAPARRR